MSYRRKDIQAGKDTVYIGRKTPSLLVLRDVEDIERLLEKEEPLQESFDMLKKEQEDAELPLTRWVISDSSVDRHGDTVNVEGWDVSKYNGTVLWSHDQSQLPVGKSLKTWKYGGQLKAINKQVPRELNPFAHMVGRLVEERYIHDCSVGFVPMDFEFNEERAEELNKWFVFDFKEQELIEWSQCNIGSNRSATVELAAGIDAIDQKEAEEGIEFFLDTQAGQKKVREMFEVLWAEKLSQVKFFTTPNSNAGDSGLADMAARLLNGD